MTMPGSCSSYSIYEEIYMVCAGDGKLKFGRIVGEK